MEKDPELVALGKRIRALRKEAKLSQEELAGRTGLSANYVGGIERGERNMSVKVLFGIARTLDADPSALLKS